MALTMELFRFVHVDFNDAVYRLAHVKNGIGLSHEYHFDF